MGGALWLSKMLEIIRCNAGTSMEANQIKKD